jgi:hypothetical protein
MIRHTLHVWVYNLLSVWWTIYYSTHNAYLRYKTRHDPQPDVYQAVLALADKYTPLFESEKNLPLGSPERNLLRLQTTKQLDAEVRRLHAQTRESR